MKYDTSISVIDFIYYTVGFKQGKKNLFYFIGYLIAYKGKTRKI